MSKKLKISKNNNRKIFIAIGVILAIGIGIFSYLFATGKIFHNTLKTLPITEEKLPSEEQKKETEEEKPKLKIVDLESKTRSYAVMINNINIARPFQSGLQDAYIIYEMIAEGGITRMMALFKDQNTAKIGTIRSSRHYYLDYALENDAIYVHWGQSTQAQNDIKALGINNINGITYGTKYFWKDSEVRKQGVGTEHTAYSSMELLKKATEKLKYRTETNQDLLFNYSVEEIDLSKMEGAKTATSIDINYSSSYKNHYDYDEKTKTYKRSVNGKAHKDYVTNEQYTFKNIIVYPVANSKIAGDTHGRQNLDNIGSGEGYFITNGYAVKIKWEKKARSSQTIYTFENGQEITLNDGNCFIQIQPKGQTLNIN